MAGKRTYKVTLTDEERAASSTTRASSCSPTRRSMDCGARTRRSPPCWVSGLGRWNGCGNALSRRGWNRRWFRDPVHAEPTKSIDASRRRSLRSPRAIRRRVQALDLAADRRPTGGVGPRRGLPRGRAAGCKKMPSARQLVRRYRDQAALRIGSGNARSGSARSRRQSSSSPLRRAGFQRGQGQHPLGRPTHPLVLATCRHRPVVVFLHPGARDP